MFLKRLELFGFKSFADRLELIFQPGVTAVVGPNGSGKSNIADSIRWVLGEQSLKSIRSHKQEDVIFNGTETRKPLGMSEVTLVLDNQDRKLPLDFTEIAVTRRIYRSGESEYLINKSHVRLREIHELFYDTGLGKEAYSIIGQGKIDAILSAKAEERRSIFEEAAGIVKYKHKKSLALQKLHDADQNLIRVGDIIHEISEQLEPIAAQAAVAEKYLSVWQELARIEINTYGREMLRWEKQIQDNSQERMNIMSELESINAQMSIFQGNQAALKLEITKKEEEYAEQNQRYYDICSGEEKINGTIRVLQERLKTSEEQIADADEKNRAAVAKKEQYEEESMALDEKILDNSLRIKSLHSSAAEQEGYLRACQERIAGYDKIIEGLKEEIIENLNDVARIRNEENRRHLAVEYLRKQHSEKTARMKKCAEEFEAMAGKIRAIDAELSTTREELARAHRDKQLAWDEELKNEKEQAAAKEAWLAMQQKYTEKKARQNAMERMEQEHEGYSQGVKQLLHEGNSEHFRQGIIGTVAELFQAREGYETALETALGGALQNIVVEHDEIAKQAIEFLKRTKAGRVTFLPLNLVEPRENNNPGLEQLLKKYGAVRGESVFTGESRLRNIVLYLLGNVLITNDLDSAIALFKETGRRYKIVTREGELLMPGGAISGGSKENRHYGFLERKAELNRLIEESRRLAEEMTAAHLQMAKLEENHEAIQKRKSEIISRIQEYEIKLAGLEKEKERWRSEAERWNKERELLEFEIAQLAEEEKQLMEKESLEKTDLGLKEENRLQLEKTMAETEKLLKEARKEQEILMHEIGEIKAKLAGAQQEEISLKQLKANLLNQIEEINLQSQKNVDLRESVSLEIDNVKNRLQEEMRRIEEIKAQKEAQLLELEKIRSQKLKIQEELAETEKQMEEWRIKQKEKEDKCHRLELRISQLTLQAENQLTYLVETHGEDWRTKLEEDAATEPISNAKSKIAELKTELKAMGSVNTGAIEEYQRLKERFAFLQKQQEDLLKAKGSLMQVISEIEETTTARFLETFVKVREEFQYIFSHLFNGGKADLILSEPEKPLESGIEIMAQPPGKKLQNLLSLSGGERAMTAISLLFSILKVKPTPFCVLDEIDATLDEANVQRFADLLSEFAKNMQFIVITHRRGTMEVSNALYGASMEERGVSKLVSLQLNEINKKEKAS